MTYISRADAIAAIEGIPPEWARKGDTAKFNQVTIEQAPAAINALPASGWQPIETAGDGPYLLWARRAGDPTFRVVCGWRYSRQWAIYGTGKSQDCLDIVEPSHWMPLPDAP